MEYVNKGVVTGLRGIRQTGRLDDDGLPALAWYGADVESLTARSVIFAMLDALDWHSLDTAEQKALLAVMVEGYQPFQRAAIRKVVRSHR